MDSLIGKLRGDADLKRLRLAPGFEDPQCVLNRHENFLFYSILQRLPGITF
jgi:hypothetical protein